MDVIDNASIRLSGRVEVARYAGPLHEASTDACLGGFSGDNLIVNTAENVLVGLMRRDVAAYLPQSVVIGSGGDLEQVSKLDSGARVAPASSDTEVRQVIARLPIVQVTYDAGVDPNTFTYVAVAKPAEATTGSLNELGLEAANGTLISHYVTEVGDDGTRARKFAKSTLEYLVVRWSLTLSLL